MIFQKITFWHFKKIDQKNIIFLESQNLLVNDFLVFDTFNTILLFYFILFCQFFQLKNIIDQKCEDVV